MKTMVNSFAGILLSGLMLGCAAITLMSKADINSKTCTPETHSIVWGAVEAWGLQTNKHNRAGISTKSTPYDLTFRRKLKDGEKYPNDGGYRASGTYGWYRWQYYDAIFINSLSRRGEFYLIVPPGDYVFHVIKGRDGTNTVEHAGPERDSGTPSPIKFSVKKPGTSYYIGTYKAHIKTAGRLNFKEKIISLLLDDEESSGEKTLETSVDKTNNPSRKEIFGRILKEAEGTPWKEILK